MEASEVEANGTLEIGQSNDNFAMNFGIPGVGSEKDGWRMRNLGKISSRFRLLWLQTINKRSARIMPIYSLHAETEPHNDNLEISTVHQSCNILTNENILKKIGQIANEADLYQLRQVSEKYYKTLNPILFDILDPHITISIVTPEVNSEAEPGAVGTTDVDIKLKATSSKLMNSKLTDVMEIPLDKLRCYKHIFRALSLHYFDSKCNLQMIKMLAPFRAYVTTLEIPMLPLPDLENWILFASINQFPNLRKLQLTDLTRKALLTDDILWMALDALEIILDNIKFKPEIILNVSNQAYHLDVLTQFGTRPNTTINLSMGNPVPKSYTGALYHGQTISLLLSQLPNVDFDFSWVRSFNENVNNTGLLTPTSIYFMDHLRTFTILWLKCGNRDNLDLQLNLSLNPTRFPDVNGVKECLIQLSSFIVDLKLSLKYWLNDEVMNDMRDPLNMDCEWPKLLRLTLEGYKHPLEILKKSPKLKKLRLLLIDQELCFFSNQNRSRKENLQDYFGNLPKLKRLCMTNENEAENNIIRLHKLDRYLIDLLPKLKFYTNGETNPAMCPHCFRDCFANKLLRASATVARVVRRGLRFVCWPCCSIPQ